MADAANLQLLRCPNCDNLLQQLPGFSPYTCRACGAVLQAKQKGVLLLDVAPMSGVETTEALAKGKERIRKLESSDSDYTSYPQPYSLNMEGPEYVDFHRESVGDFRHPPLRSRPVMDQWDRKTKGPAQTRFGDFRYYEEGQSSYEKNSYYDPGERNGRYQGHDIDGLSRIDNLVDDRAELIRRIDELRDQISRSCDISDKSKERLLSSDPYSRHQAANYFTDDVSSPYFNDPHGYSPYGDRYNPQMLDPYPVRRHTHDLTHYSNNKSFRREIPDRPPQSQYTQHHLYHEPFPGHYGPVSRPAINHHDHFMPHHHENFFQVPQNISPFRPLNMNAVLNNQSPKKFVTAHKNAQVILPIAGGAPFIVCTSCFETLKLPNKRILSGENGHKVKCGACSSIIIFKLGNTRITALSSDHADQVPTEDDEGSSGALDENMRYWNDGSNNANSNAFSNDYDNVGDKKSNSDLSEDKQTPELPVLTQVNSLPDETSLDNIAVDRFDKGKESQRPEQERISLDRTNSQHKFVKDASVATEIDVSNEFTNSYESQDSVEVREADIPKVKSFFKMSTQSVEACGSEVFVNGHFIPDRIVKKAEKLAGPIQPGEYWYDIQAGFWGVMGHPCLGIIMPNIEEFHHPMLQKCAAGNTEVFINGRELHHKDLDLLCKRGLPIARQRSYLVDITGKVIDEETGEELDGLGKLAPTVQRSKHGFGMKIPRFIAQIQSQE